MRQNDRVTYRIIQRDGCLVYLLDMPKRSTLPPDAAMAEGRPSVLLLALHSGMPMAEVAGFLARDEKEMQEKVEDLRHYG